MRTEKGGGSRYLETRIWLAARHETSPDVGMTDAAATGPGADSPLRPSHVSARLDDSDPPWPLRPWIMAAICAVAGLAFPLFIAPHYGHALAPWRRRLAGGGGAGP